jgi:hypothetical protein
MKKLKKRKKKNFLEYLNSDFDIMIYTHLLTWVGYGLIGLNKKQTTYQTR